MPGGPVKRSLAGTMYALSHSITLMEAARQGEAELLCVGGELRKINGALVGGQALEFSPPFVQISLSLAPPDWTLKKAAQIRSFLRQR